MVERSFELAHSGWENPDKLAGLPSCCVEVILVLFVFTPSVCECLEVMRHTNHLEAASSPHSSSGLEWSIFNSIKEKPNPKSIDFKFLSISLKNKGSTAGGFGLVIPFLYTQTKC